MIALLLFAGKIVPKILKKPATDGKIDTYRLVWGEQPEFLPQRSFSPFFELDPELSHTGALRYSDRLYERGLAVIVFRQTSGVPGGGV